VDGSAQVLCGDLTLRTLHDGRDSCPCPPSEGRLAKGDSYYRSIPENLPYIQHPRNTLVLESRPLLRWHATGALSYTVAIRSSGKIIWRQEGVKDNTMTYPADAPTLEPGVDYGLVVQDNATGVQSDADPARGIGFRMASPAQEDALVAHCGEIPTLSDLDVPSLDYALALCYATWAPEGGGHGPWGAAWLRLEAVAQTHDTPAVYLWMGHLLRTMKSPTDAEAAYRAALARAEAMGDVESQAAAHAGLWWVTQDKAHWAQAVALYEQLGDAAAVEELR
jgi:hypothetical protein